MEDKILNVTSDDCEFFNNGKKIKSIYNNPILICKLKKGEMLEFSAVADKGIALNHARYSSVSTCFYEKKDDNKFIFKLSSLSQYNEKEILVIACDILIFLLEKLKKKLINMKYTKDNHGKITLENYDHTIGNLLSNVIQSNPNIEYASYKMDHLLVRTVTIEYITNGGKKINDILKISFDKLISLYENIKKKCNNLKI